MENKIGCDNFTIGNNSVIEPTAVITGINGNAERVSIGDNVYIGHDVQIICNEISIGDYCTIHHHTNIHGYKPCSIGHNAWIGQYCIIDTIGGTTIGNNCGIGAHSQLWSHIKYGDTLEGCRFASDSPLIIGDDVWFVGHCIVSPIIANDKSVALVGSVITKNMDENRVYGGSPAKDLTDKIGPPFNSVSVEDKFIKMTKHLKDFKSNNNIKIVKSISEINFNDEISYFDVSTRKYTKKRSKQEISFMKFLLPELAKFTPFSNE